MSPTQKHYEWICAHLDKDGRISRYVVKDEGQKRFGLLTTNHMFGTAHPLLRQVPGTDLAELV